MVEHGGHPSRGLFDGPSVDDALRALVVLCAGRRLVVLTGAGISTESGIPDYRGPVTRHRARNPVRFATFTKDLDARRRYWARSFIGWPRIRDAAPNAGHRALVTLEAYGHVASVITQNVDGLHGRAGARQVTELHGALRRVRCLDCGEVSAREDLQARLADANPRFMVDGGSAPDGDVDLSDDVARAFVVLGCRACGGPLKPDVVFFGENVDAALVTRACDDVDVAGALLVVGSSLEVYSGRRFVDRAVKRGIPCAIVNLGPTRSDDVATVRVDGRAGDALDALARALTGTSAVDGAARAAPDASAGASP